MLGFCLRSKSLRGYSGVHERSVEVLLFTLLTDFRAGGGRRFAPYRYSWSFLHPGRGTRYVQSKLDRSFSPTFEVRFHFLLTLAKSHSDHHPPKSFKARNAPAAPLFPCGTPIRISNPSLVVFGMRRFRKSFSSGYC
ncbi:hypothetical protein FNV43_RR00356 [Rhamnella rubrinervis]|uniref:Uncharacterized protein n=1 Tax=Rhamnella rubrinervis TaxID=2594499 RepID=A0A8K0HQG7_9ROSA|nr:hypothetical protein FNV43_RR00356 [Rhamnella rubrinervis]